MDSADVIFSYFSDLSDRQRQQFLQLGDIYHRINQQVNLVSRRDIEHLYEKHILHSTAIAKCCDFEKESHILDVGTGGGFPGIPLAILFPSCTFYLVDSITKKIRAVEQVCSELGLKNVVVLCERVENLAQTFDYVVCRAVSEISQIYGWVGAKTKQQLICLKGGDIDKEMTGLQKEYHIYNISDFFSEEFFETKKVLVVEVHDNQ